MRRPSALIFASFGAASGCFFSASMYLQNSVIHSFQPAYW
jgi:hypothetical protein